MEATARPAAANTSTKTYATEIAAFAVILREALERIEREMGMSDALPITGELSHALASLRRAEVNALRAGSGGPR